MQKILSFIRSVLSEPSGQGSTTRTCMIAIFMFVIGAGSALILKIHTPVTLADFDAFLGAAGAFIATTCGPLYLINKGSDVLKGNATQQ